MKKLFVLAIVMLLSSAVVFADWLDNPLNPGFCINCSNTEEFHGECQCPTSPHLGTHVSGAHITCVINVLSVDNYLTCDGCRIKLIDGGCGQITTYGRCYVTGGGSTESCGCASASPHGNSLYNSNLGVAGYKTEVRVRDDFDNTLGWAIDHHRQNWQSGMGGMYTGHWFCTSEHKVMQMGQWVYHTGSCTTSDFCIHQTPGYHNPLCGQEADLTDPGYYEE